MNNDNVSNAINSSLVADCRLLNAQVPLIKVVHCYRKANFYADALARLGSLQDLNILYYNSSPPNLLDAYMSGLYGLFHFKLCLELDVVDSVS
ncbi:hypothetical protein SO802_006471 [Lithocarpus litseifolius]|uniref:RNase H type-1 domain-containing protein n=1 Tax=Lithocarpus litseifolius TaxID=425828 RepID=A0AAW2DP75_9ROSI